MRVSRAFYFFGVLTIAFVLTLTLVWKLDMTSPVAALDTETLKNDDWPAQSELFPAGFIIGETAAARLVPSGAFTAQVTSVSFLFGGADDQKAIIMTIWEDTGGTVAPGTELFSHTYQVTTSDSTLQTIDLSAEDVSISGTFRVGIKFLWSGLPSIGTDSGGIMADRNFIYTDDSWIASPFSGDFIIRATLDTGEVVILDNFTYLPIVLQGF